MKLEQQVVSLELAKQLKKLGVKQESEFYLVRGYAYNDPEIGGNSWSVVSRSEAEGTISKMKDEHLSAFTVAELGEMLPESTLVQKYPGFWRCDWNSDDSNGRVSLPADTEADARAKMLIYLIEKGLVKTGKEAA